MNIKHIVKKYSKPSKKGFSLVELIAVIAILAITAGATLSVFLMVHQVTRDAGEITVDQYNTSQMERLIRNELQVSSGIDVVGVTNLSTGTGVTIQPNDEYFAYDKSTKRLTFFRANESKAFKTRFVIDDVDEVTVNIAPLNGQDSSTTQPYKLFYTIKTSHYEYSGGIVLSNTKVDRTTSMTKIGVTNKTLHWTSAGGTDNDSAVFFHYEVSGAVAKAGSSSTP